MATDYDLLIIGGGIHGAGIAQAAAARGYSALLLEQTEIASGTSSRSSKLIHGGLRYLESGQFSLVQECLRERALLLKLAPQLVKLVPFYIPVYAHTTRRPWLLTAGLSLYALLGGLDAVTRFKRLPKKIWGNLDGLETNNLQAVFQYYDAQTDDATLTRAVMRSAQTLGAELALPATFLGATLSDGENQIDYQHQGKNLSCTARVIVNAAGPWVQKILDRITPTPAQYPVELVQGAHIIVPGQIVQGIYYVEAADRRAVFVMPWQGHTLVGTTENVYRGDPSAVAPLPQEQAYLLQTLTRYFPQHGATQEILGATAGLRVLPQGAGAAFNRPRETLLYPDREHQPRLLTVYGGKLTTYRLTAARVMQRLAGSLPTRKRIADTNKLMLR